MVAILDWTDGFGNDTVVVGIFASLEDASKHMNLSGHCYQEFEFGRVDFDWYNAEPIKNGGKMEREAEHERV